MFCTSERKQLMMRCLHHPLKGLAISSGATAEQGSNAVREDALDGAPVKVSLGFCRHAKVSSESKDAFGQFLQPSALENSVDLFF